MKYAVIPYIAFVLILSLAIGIEYDCEGREMFPTYYASPFVFMQKSLATSLEYYYSVSGLILNVLVWSFFLFLIHKGIQTIIKKLRKPKLMRLSYKIIIGLMIAFSSFHVVVGSMMTGRVFNKLTNYWYWNIDKEAKSWGVTCKGEVITFID